MKCNILSCLLFAMVFLSIMTTKMMMVNAYPSNGTSVTCSCRCLNWSEFSTPSEPMASCDTCNAAACRKMGGSCTSGTITGISCT
ncbi:unnamed protein product [Adineta steineri]|uniref:Uncharacterized protein n=1 Tax=Adineta steineri TaxID=433720 RepID=A0A814J9N8_9BILA|nr:unnamed protein product [Adineta steineri]CAF1068511.1 unnamed protein product [Adineta steineri]